MADITSESVADITSECLADLLRNTHSFDAPQKAGRRKPAVGSIREAGEENRLSVSLSQDLSPAPPTRGFPSAPLCRAWPPREGLVNQSDRQIPTSGPPCQWAALLYAASHGARRDHPGVLVPNVPKVAVRNPSVLKALYEVTHGGRPISAFSSRCGRDRRPCLYRRRLISTFRISGGEA